MYVVIVGCSESGYHLSKALIAGGHEVVVVDKNPERYQLLNEELGSVALLGDGTDEVALKRAGIARADVVVSLTGTDATNLVISQMTKHIFQVPRTMALIKDPKNEPIFHETGVDVVVNSTHLVLARLEEGIPGRPLVHLMNLRVAGMELVSVSIPADSNIIGKRLSEIELPPNSFITLMVKKTGATLPTGRSVVEPEDELVAVTLEGDEQILYDILTGV
ncbi:MAG: portal protein [Chloroflexi bacterium]|nr:portal protein [Chloroflexota bacterium]MDP6498264.1 TrkA family potassium uptake protein [Dehalococcoidia bacterium]MQG55134.1 TrkA family potassium uptake protein [SAR202 cluster bacterium]|tara:strand:- start:177148 stop:177807 length:660 start_codon:yes stop_codon:yes gene_type:complete